MRKIQPLLLLIAILTYACSTDTSESKLTAKKEKATSLYLRWVGDSKYDPNLDDSTFQLCHSEYQVKQYFNMGNGLQYQGGKQALESLIQKKYDPVSIDQSGWIRIRFIVNCEGQTGRFRLTAADQDYHPFQFDTRIIDQLERITRNLDGWLPQYEDGRSEDYYQYLTFKIKEGQLTEILP